MKRLGFLVVPSVLFATMSACGPDTSGKNLQYRKRQSHLNFLKQTKHVSAKLNFAAEAEGFKEAEYPYYSPSDGCSGGISERGKRRFDQSCRLHDECYRVGDHTREECDLIFLKAMEKKCTQLTLAVEPLCDSEARTMYEAVSFWSNEIFKRRQSNQLKYENKMINQLSPLELGQK